MVQVLSKMLTTKVADSCIDFVHPGRPNCFRECVQTGCFVFYESIKLYTFIYTLNLLLKRKVPTKQEFKQTILWILRSTQIPTTGFTGFHIFICTAGNFLDGFNAITGLIVPSALCSLMAILLERPPRRPLLALYLSQEVTIILWNLLQSRGLVKSIPYGTTILFSVSMAVLLMYMKAGLHVNKSIDGRSRVDPIFKYLRYIVGQNEEKDYWSKNICETMHTSNSEHDTNNTIGDADEYSSNKRSQQILTVFHRLINRIKNQGKHDTCPHSSSCLHYLLQGALKSFMTGIGIQTGINLLFNVPKIIRNPKHLMKLFFQRNFLSIPLTLTGFTGIFRTALCSLRWITGKDNMCHALLAGLLAGSAYSQFNNNTIALYVLWKTLDILYQRGKQARYFPTIPYGHEMQFTLCAVILYYGVIFEPNSVRPGFWKTSNDLSGGRIAEVDRSRFSKIGLDSAQQLETIMRRSKRRHGVKTLFG